LKSFVVLEGTEEGNGFKGVQIPMSWKSVLLGWFRGAFVVGIIVSVLVAGIAGIEFLDKQQHDALETVFASLAQVAGFALLYWITWNFSRASYQRALDLGEQLQIPPEYVEQILSGMPPPGTEEAGSSARPTE
jgi:hypothetical protein